MIGLGSAGVYHSRGRERHLSANQATAPEPTHPARETNPYEPHLDNRPQPIVSRQASVGSDRDTNEANGSRSLAGEKQLAAGPFSSLPEHLIQWGLLVLVALMPFHAFLSVWLGTVFGHRTLIQSWKEVLLIILGGLAVWLITCQPARLQRLRQPIIMAAAGLAGLGLIITTITQPGLTATVFGLKTDFEFIALFVLAVLVTSPTFTRRLIWTVLAAGAGVVAFGLLQIYVWPPDFLVGFGYGLDTIQPYLLLDPVTESLRFPATLGGPNQLGAYLIIILALSLVAGWTRRRRWLLALAPAAGLVLVYTYSRAAWIGALIAVMLILFGLTPARLRQWYVIGAAALALLALAATTWILSQNSDLENYILHDAGQIETSVPSSDELHAASLQEGLHAVLQHPLGHGLGTAGPAVFQTHAGPIIENHYLQIGYEYGLAGLLLWLAVLALLARQLWQRATRTRSRPALALLCSLAGISVSALFLPIWTDSTLIFTFWTLAGASGSLKSTEAGYV